jgi:hypothetical protein
MYVSWLHLVNNERQTTKHDIRKAIGKVMDWDPEDDRIQVDVAASVWSRGQKDYLGSSREGMQSPYRKEPNEVGVIGK